MTALNGINVLEIASNLGAEYAAWILAEQGARTIKVEPPSGAAHRGFPHFHVLNRSKRSLFFDSLSAANKPRIEEIIRWADIIVTGATPARLAAIGQDFDSIRRINPRAIAVNLPPLGSRGPLAEFDANDDLVAAFGGITGSQWARSSNPVALVFPAASYSAGLMAATAATAALCARGANGPGQAVEVSLLAGAFSLQTGGILHHESMTRLYHGPQDPLGPIPVYRLFQAGDGEYFFAACGNTTFWGKFAIALERPDLVADERFESAPWGIPSAHWQELKDIIEPIIRTRPRAEWLRILRDADVPNAPVMTRKEFIDWEQTRALGMRQELDDPTLGATVQMGLPFFLRDTPGAITNASPAAGDERGALEWLADNRARDARPAAALPTVNSGKGPLDGVLVLDFASYIAGSYGPMILAQLGAQVIKIESLEGDSFRHFGFGFLGWNQGKRGLALDLTKPEGREIVHRLAARADVIVENLRPGRMRRFGYDYDSLAALNPRLVYMSVNGFGNRGPEHNQPGFDPLLQARSGVMAAQGGPHAHPVYLTCAICDYGAAMVSALGCVMALYARQQTGRGQFCETSLLQASMAMQAGEFIFYSGRPNLENGDPERRGSSALSRAYSCRDGEWLFISVEASRQWDALRSALAAIPALDWNTARSEPADSRLSAALESAFGPLSRTVIIERLRHAGVPIVPVRHFKEMFDDPQIAANELIAEVTHPEFGKVLQTGMLTKFSATQAKIERAAPLLGQHTDEILRAYLGYDDAKIAALRADRIVR
jgi:crotonobetainyl-CoA:carnitine CoA-transferase CaiB-like acyl-CoA transferase